MRWAVTILAWIGITLALGVVLFFVVMSLAGPHGGILPEVFHRPVLATAWAILLLVPAYVAHRVYLRLRSGSQPDIET